MCIYSSCACAASAHPSKLSARPAEDIREVHAQLVWALTWHMLMCLLRSRCAASPLKLPALMC